MRAERAVWGVRGRKPPAICYFTPLANAISKNLVRVRDWNELRVVARGERLTYYLNGKIASVVIDREPGKRVEQGFLALQLDGGDQMRVEFRHLRVKRLRK